VGESLIISRLLKNAQAGIWLAQHLDPDSAAYNASAAYRASDMFTRDRAYWQKLRRDMPAPPSLGRPQAPGGSASIICRARVGNGATCITG
jgi:hypothetical protein